MMGVFFINLFAFVIGILFQFKEKTKKIELFLSFIVLFVLFLGINETNDSQQYKIVFENLEKAPDIGFLILSRLTQMLNRNYRFLILLYYILSMMFILKILKYFNVNSLFVILNLQIYTMFYHLNQIRYFLAFYMFIYLYIKSKKNKYLNIFLFVPFLLHKAILLVYFSRLIQRWSLKKICKFSLIINFFSLFIFEIIVYAVNKFSIFNHYSFYLSKGKSISSKGWGFTILFPIIWWFYLVVIHKKIRFLVENDEKYYIIVKILLLPTFFLFLSTKFLDISYRYIYIFQFMNLIYISYSFKYFNYKKRIVLIWITFILSLVNYYYQFELGELIGVKTQKIDLLKIYETYELNLKYF